MKELIAVDYKLHLGCLYALKSFETFRAQKTAMKFLYVTKSDQNNEEID